MDGSPEMKEAREKNRDKKRRRSKNKEFMDAALDAFIRDQALQKWNEVDGLWGGAGVDLVQAVKSSSEFLDKGPYREIWGRWWQQQVVQVQEVSVSLFAKIENAVRGAVMEERDARKRQQNTQLEDSSIYKEFISRQMEHLLFEAGGEIEEDI